VKALRAGQYVKHSLYGFGFVTESDSERTSIAFDVHGPKKFVTELMVVEAAGDPPPGVKLATRPKRARAPKPKKVAAEAVAVAK